KLKQDRPWAKKGYVQGKEQFLVKQALDKPTIASEMKGQEGLSFLKSDGNLQTIKGQDFVVKFDKVHGTIYSLQYGNQKIFKEGEGPQINAIRAFTNNDNWAYQKWFTNGLHNLKHKATSGNFIKNKDGTISVIFTVESQAPNAAKILGGTSSGRNTVVELTDQKFGPSDLKFSTS